MSNAKNQASSVFTPDLEIYLNAFTVWLRLSYFVFSHDQITFTESKIFCNLLFIQTYIIINEPKGILIEEQKCILIKEQKTFSVRKPRRILV